MKQEKERKKKEVFKNENVEFDKYSETFGPRYIGQQSLDSRRLVAQTVLGPYCPKCHTLWTAFEIIHNPIMDIFQGRIECKMGCRKTWGANFNEGESKWEIKREIKGSSALIG